MKQGQEPVAARAQRVLSSDVLAPCVGFMLLSSIPFMLLWFLIYVTLVPWYGYCCPYGWPPPGTWQQIMNDFFQDNTWIVGLITLSIAGLGLVRLIQRLGRSADRPKVMVLFSVITLAAVIAYIPLMLLLRNLFVLLAPVFRSLSTVVVPYTGLSDGDLIGNALAIGITIIALMLLYNGYPRAFWSKALARKY